LRVLLRFQVKAAAATMVVVAGSVIGA